jgi:hypothetical protein
VSTRDTDELYTEDEILREVERAMGQSADELTFEGRVAPDDSLPPLHAASIALADCSRSPGSHPNPVPDRVETAGD